MTTEDYKGGWLVESPWAFFGGLSAEFQELFNAAYDFNPTTEAANAVVAECADVADSALMIADVVRG